MHLYITVGTRSESAGENRNDKNPRPRVVRRRVVRSLQRPFRIPKNDDGARDAVWRGRTEVINHLKKKIFPERRKNTLPSVK